MACGSYGKVNMLISPETAGHGANLLSHTDLTEVTGMVLVDVRSVVVLTTGHTTTTRVLSVLADTTVTGRDVATAIKKI